MSKPAQREAHALIEKGVEFAQKAVQYDLDACKGSDPASFEAAKKNYLQAIDCYFIALKYEKNERTSDILREKMNSYLERAEIIKEWLDAHQQAMNERHSTAQDRPARGESSQATTRFPLVEEFMFPENFLASARQSELWWPFLENGIRYTSKALEMDRRACSSGKFEHFRNAKALYLRALDYYMTALKYTSGDYQRSVLRHKITIHVERAETVNESLNQLKDSLSDVTYLEGGIASLAVPSPGDTQSPSLDRSVFASGHAAALKIQAYAVAKEAVALDKEACSGNDPAKIKSARDLYQISVGKFIEMLRIEKDEARKKILHERIRGYTDRLHVLNDWIDVQNKLNESGPPDDNISGDLLSVPSIGLRTVSEHAHGNDPDSAQSLHKDSEHKEPGDGASGEEAVESMCAKENGSDGLEKIETDVKFNSDKIDNTLKVRTPIEFGESHTASNDDANSGGADL